MQEKDLDLIFVYGDEYRKENLRYVCNFWPMFERGAMLLGRTGNPIVLCAPEGEQVAREMSVWEDIRLVQDLEAVTVPDKIDYPLAVYTSFATLAEEFRKEGSLNRLGVVGLGDMPAGLTESVRKSFDCEIIDIASVLYEMRVKKTPDEIACLKEAARLAEIGVRAMMAEDLIGKTERYAASIAEGAARAAGAEAVIFTVFGSGDRSARIIGRPENKIIEDGDMSICSLAIQYEG